MEIWTPRNTFAYPGIDMGLNFFFTRYSLCYKFNMYLNCRQRILFAVVSGDVTKDQTCFW